MPNPEKLDGETVFPRNFASTIATAGDLNGDGAPEIVVGARHSLGAFHILLGGDWDFDGADIPLLEEFGLSVTVDFEQPTTNFGRFAAGLGDFDGDGLDDLALTSSGGGRNREGYAFSPLRHARAREGDAVGPHAASEGGGSSRGWWASTGATSAGSCTQWETSTETGSWISASPARRSVSSRRGRTWCSAGADRPREIELSYLGHAGFKLSGTEGSRMSSFNGGMAAGDFDGDGHRDLAIGEGTGEGQKRALVIFGRRRGETVPERGGERGRASGSLRRDRDPRLAVPRRPGCRAARTRRTRNDSGRVDLSDGVYLLGHLFLGGPEPPPPFADPGIDPTPDELARCR